MYHEFFIQKGVPVPADFAMLAFLLSFCGGGGNLSFKKARSVFESIARSCRLATTAKSSVPRCCRQVRSAKECES